MGGVALPALLPSEGGTRRAWPLPKPRIVNEVGRRRAPALPARTRTPRPEDDAHRCPQDERTAAGAMALAAPHAKAHATRPGRVNATFTAKSARSCHVKASAAPGPKAHPVPCARAAPGCKSAGRALHTSARCSRPKRRTPCPAPSHAQLAVPKRTACPAPKPAQLPATKRLPRHEPSHAQLTVPKRTPCPAKPPQLPTPMARAAS